MNIASAKPGDIVLVDKKGRRFHAVITAKDKTLRVMPIERNISYREATAREVKGLWRKSRQKSGAKTTEENDG